MRFVLFVLLGWSASLLAAPKVSEKHAEMAKGLLCLKVMCACSSSTAASWHKIRGDLDLSTRAGLLKGGEEGPSIILGRAMKFPDDGATARGRTLHAGQGR